MIKVLSMASIALLLLTLPNGHTDRASLGGRVTDEDLVAVPSATVSARNLFSGESAYVSTDAAGLYKFDSMKQGRYSVFAESEGYGATWVPSVFLVRGQHTELDIRLVKSRKNPQPQGSNSSPGGAT